MRRGGPRQAASKGQGVGSFWGDILQCHFWSEVRSSGHVTEFFTLQMNQVDVSPASGNTSSGGSQSQPFVARSRPCAQAP